MLMGQIEKLIRRYNRAQQKLLSEIESIEAAGSIASYERQVLAAVTAIIAELGRYTEYWLDENIAGIYESGLTQAANEVGKQFAGAGMVPPAVNMTLTQRDYTAIGIIRDNLGADLTNALNFAGRIIEDDVRQAGLLAVEEKLAHGLTVKQAKQNLVSMLSEKGIYAIRTGDGKYIQLDKYAEMAIRSTQHSAVNAAGINYNEKIGNDLVYITEHYGSCPICAPYQGRVYSISGNDPRYPSLYGATPLSPVYKTFHPNCRHRILSWIESLHSAEENAQMMEYSNRAFEPGGEGWTEAQTKAYQRSIDAYNKGQEVKRRLYTDRRQYERYKDVLGAENMPKTFASYRRMKYNDSEWWDGKKAEYRAISREQSIIETAKTGGRHSGKYLDATLWSDKSVQKAAKSYAAQVAEHTAKIENPAQYDAGWNKKTVEQKAGLLNKWQKDLDRNDELRIIMERILKDRGLE